MKDPYLYPNSEVLKNLGGIQDAQELKDMEADYTFCVVKHFSDFMASLWKVHPYKDVHVIIRTKLGKPSKINGLHYFSPYFFTPVG